MSSMSFLSQKSLKHKICAYDTLSNFLYKW